MSMEFDSLNNDNNDRRYSYRAKFIYTNDIQMDVSGPFLFELDQKKVTWIIWSDSKNKQGFSNFTHELSKKKKIKREYIYTLTN